MDTTFDNVWIEAGDKILDEYPTVAKCRALRTEFARQYYWPNVWVVNERGNTTLLAVGYNGYKIVHEYV